MKSARLALATCETIPALPPEEQHYIRALAERGVEAVPAVWSNPAVAWDAFDAVIIRSTWDYHRRLPEFRAWIDRMAAAGIALWNPPAIIQWNAEKTYLRDLAARGASVVPTHWVTNGDNASLSAILKETGWQRAVVKPTVSATAYETWLVTPAGAPRDEERFQELRHHSGVMIQPFLESIVHAGEWSLIFFNGTFSHAVLKRAAMGDFRVQSEWGGTSQLVSAPPGLVDQARRVLETVEGPWLYARVDGCVVDGTFQLIELEMLEPVFFLDMDPGAAARLADATIERLKRRS